MKIYNKIRYGIIATTVILTFSSCKKNLDDLFQNPESFKETQIEFLLPSGIDNSLRQEYTDIYNNHLNSIGQVTQVVAGLADPVSGNFYNWTNDKGRWGDYYTNSSEMLALKGIEQIYSYKLNDAQREEYKPYLAMAKVLMAYNTARATDLFDDMPYSEAFQAQNLLYDQPVNLKPKYDSQQSIYYAILDDLKAAALTLSTYELQPTVYPTHAGLLQQDILFKGDLTKWIKFANSLRLRYAVRISAKDATRARAEINDLISTSAPLILDNADNAYLYLGSQAISGGSGISQLRAFNELPNQIYAPKLMVDEMTAASDPRLNVFFAKPTGAKATATTIVGLSPGLDAKNSSGLTNATVPEQIASLNPVTFVKNAALPTGVGITAADVNFLLAEASVKGLITGKTFDDASKYYTAGINRSIEAYYDFYIKSTATGKDATLTTQPSTAAKNAAITSTNYVLTPTNAISRIALQKWMNTGIFQSYETFAEYRRLDLPVLLPDIQNGIQLNTADKLPVRLIIPTSEIGSNGANYATVSSKNLQTARVWWDVN